jgi:hypothetical protein
LLGHETENEERISGVSVESNLNQSDMKRYQHAVCGGTNKPRTKESMRVSSSVVVTKNQECRKTPIPKDGNLVAVRTEISKSSSRVVRLSKDWFNDIRSAISVRILRSERFD